MTFVSYAQNFEDVLLWRALKDVDQGFYVDLGAWSPIEDSVTAAFYAAGWHGVNVEPNPELFAELTSARSRDINLAVAMSDTEGATQLLLGNNTGLACIAESTQAHNEIRARAIDVPCTTLNNLVATYIPSNQPVHFLKIDIEGMEAAVVNHTNWANFQPWIIVIESTKPLSMIPNFDGWEPTLFTAGYQFVYTDGINRFYVAPAFTHLKKYFCHPPNYFDDFISHSTQLLQNSYTEVSNWATELELNVQIHRSKFTQLDEEITALRAQIEQQQAEIQQQQAEIQQQQAEIQQQQAEIQQQQAEIQQHISVMAALKESTSWRITAPLRALVNRFKRNSQRL